MTQVEAPDFDMAEAGPLRLPATASPPSAIICRRTTLAPLPNDYRALLELSTPFALRREDKVVWLELQDGRLGLDFKEGDLTEAESAAWQAWINKVQPYLNKKVPPSAS